MKNQENGSVQRNLEEPGVLIVPGLLPSGRNALFRMLVEAILDQDPKAIGLFVFDGGNQDGFGERRMSASGRMSTSGRMGTSGALRRVHPMVVNTPGSYPESIFMAASRVPDLLLIDRLDEITVTPALEAARRGLCVISQLDSPFRGQGLLHRLVELGATEELLDQVSWIVSVLRIPVLCPDCRREYEPDSSELAHIERLLASFQGLGEVPPLPVAGKLVYYQKKGCAKCHFTGRRGDMAVLDVSRATAGQATASLPMEASLWDLVERGHLALDDLLHFDEDLLHSLFHELTTAYDSLGQAQAALVRTRSELQAASRVLNQRNQALFSFQDIGYALIRSDELSDLAQRVCRHAEYPLRCGQGCIVYSSARRTRGGGGEFGLGRCCG